MGWPYLLAGCGKSHRKSKKVLTIYRNVICLPPDPLVSLHFKEAFPVRGEDAQQHAMYSYLSPEERVPAHHPLRPMRQITDRVLKGLSKLFTQMYARLGRPSIPPEKRLRALWLQIL